MFHPLLTHREPVRPSFGPQSAGRQRRRAGGRGSAHEAAAAAELIVVQSRRRTRFQAISRCDPENRGAQYRGGGADCCRRRAAWRGLSLADGSPGAGAAVRHRVCKAGHARTDPTAGSEASGPLQLRRGRRAGRRELRRRTALDAACVLRSQRPARRCCRSRAQELRSSAADQISRGAPARHQVCRPSAGGGRGAEGHAGGAQQEIRHAHLRAAPPRRQGCSNGARGAAVRSAARSDRVPRGARSGSSAPAASTTTCPPKSGRR